MIHKTFTAHGVAKMQIDATGSFLAIDFAVTKPNGKFVRVGIPTSQIETLIAHLQRASIAVQMKNSPSKEVH